MRCRSVFISDVHLGFKGCRAEELLRFLQSVQTERLFLVGDIVDFWSLRRAPFWPRAHHDVVRTILAKAKDGTRVIFIPGNHDAELREFAGATFGHLEIHREYVHETAEGRRLLVIHGDEFDGVVKCSPWLARLGDVMYDFILFLNHHWNRLRRARGLPYWSLAGYIKSKVGNAVQYIESFERAAAHEARRRGMDGVVCGHIHRAGFTEIDGTLYCNDGDWVESCSALVEDMFGRLALTTWSDVRLPTAAPIGVPVSRAA